MKIPEGTTILVADGSHMLLLRNQGSALHPDLKVIEHRSFANPPDRELASDAPGRVDESANPGRNTYAGTSPHQENEDHFAIDAARFLNEATWLSGTPAMVVAPPRTLAMLRRHYDRAVKDRLLVELARDLVHCTVPEIARRILDFEPGERSAAPLQA